MRRLLSALSVSLTVLLVAVPWPPGNTSALGLRFQQTALAAPQPTRTPPPGGAGPRASVEGCVNEWLFNGVWRLRVLKVDAIRKPPSSGSTPGWGVTIEMRNGTKATLSMPITGIDGTGAGVDLSVADGNTLEMDRLDFQKIAFKQIPQGGGVTHQLKYYFSFGTQEGDVQKPTKFLMEINPATLKKYSVTAKGARYTTANPSFRVRLDCRK